MLSYDLLARHASAAYHATAAIADFIRTKTIVFSCQLKHLRFQFSTSDCKCSTDAALV